MAWEGMAYEEAAPAAVACKEDAILVGGRQQVEAERRGARRGRSHARSAAAGAAAKRAIDGGRSRWFHLLPVLV